MIKMGNELLIESEQFYSVLLDNMPDVIMILDRDGTILYINHTLPEYTVEQVTGTCVTGYLSEDHRQNYMQAIEEAIRTSKQQSVEVMAAGPSCWVARLIPVKNRDGDIENVMSISTDITSRKLIEIGQQESEQRFRTLFENSTDAIFVVDPDTQKIYDVNNQAMIFLGYTRDELLSMSVPDMHPEEKLNVVMEAFGRFREGEENLAAEIPVRHKNGTILYVDITRGIMTVDGKYYLAGFFRDVTEQKKAKDALQQSQRNLEEDIAERKKTELALRESEISTNDLLKQNRKLTQRLFNVQEEEQKRLARELHDEFGQWLTAINFNSQAINNRYGSADPDLREMIDNIITSGDHLYTGIRMMLRQLRPTSLDEVGLIDSLRELISKWKESNPGIVCNLSVEGELDTLSDELINSLYRIVQEGLTNVSKHAGASNVVVSLSRRFSDEQTKEIAEIKIEDDGKGMLDEKSEKGLGLLGMRERTLAFGGEFELNNKKNEGLQIIIRIPVEIN